MIRIYRIIEDVRLSISDRWRQRALLTMQIRVLRWSEFSKLVRFASNYGSWVGIARCSKLLWIDNQIIGSFLGQNARIRRYSDNRWVCIWICDCIHHVVLVTMLALFALYVVTLILQFFILTLFISIILPSATHDCFKIMFKQILWILILELQHLWIWITTIILVGIIINANIEMFWTRNIWTLGILTL